MKGGAQQAAADLVAQHCGCGRLNGGTVSRVSFNPVRQLLCVCVVVERRLWSVCPGT